jgi:hypothetical protein
MIRYLYVFLILITSHVWGKSLPQLRVGDILLQPLKCWSCSLIEAEEETIFSHAGVVLAIAPHVLVGEAYGKVQRVTLDDFMAKTEPGQQIRVIRFRNEKILQAFELYSKQLTDIFEAQFKNLKYDQEFRWNNLDSEGYEKLYCTEFLSKLFQAFLGIDTPIKRMHFQRNREHWVKYFKGNVPDNQWGNSPGDYERSDLFYHVGDL